jgi:hypothetical protein
MMHLHHAEAVPAGRFHHPPAPHEGDALRAQLLQPVRFGIDVVALLVAVLAFIATLHWTHGYADRQYGAMWPQILATSAGYGVFLLVLVIAIFVRRAWLRRG